MRYRVELHAWGEIVVDAADMHALLNDFRMQPQNMPTWRMTRKSILTVNGIPSMYLRSIRTASEFGVKETQIQGRPAN